MLQWLSENLGTILVCAVLVLVVGLVIRKIIRDKRSGKSCDCGCGGCDGCCSSCRHANESRGQVP